MKGKRGYACAFWSQYAGMGNLLISVVRENGKISCMK